MLFGNMKVLNNYLIKKNKKDYEKIFLGLTGFVIYGLLLLNNLELKAGL